MEHVGLFVDFNISLYNKFYIHCWSLLDMTLFRFYLYIIYCISFCDQQVGPGITQELAQSLFRGQVIHGFRFQLLNLLCSSDPRTVRTKFDIFGLFHQSHHFSISILPLPSLSIVVLRLVILCMCMCVPSAYIIAYAYIHLSSIRVTFCIILLSF